MEASKQQWRHQTRPVELSTGTCRVGGTRRSGSEYCRHRRLSQHETPSDSSDCPEEQSDAQNYLAAVIWKRRSGGKLSSRTRSWERTRIDLKGSILTCQASSGNINWCRRKQQQVQEEEEQQPSSSPKTSVGWLYSNTKYAFDGLRYAANYATTSMTEAASTFVPYIVNKNTASNNSSSGEQGNDASHLDLVNERASVAATRSRASAPTPFILSVRANYGASGYYDTHWKLCFDTREEQMTWLAALTDVVSQRSWHDFYLLRNRKFASREENKDQVPSFKELRVSWDNEGGSAKGEASAASGHSSQCTPEDVQSGLEDTKPQLLAGQMPSGVPYQCSDQTCSSLPQDIEQNLMTIAWKQRSGGFGRRVWERRRFVLERSRIMYYTLSVNADKDDINDTDDEGVEDQRSNDDQLIVNTCEVGAETPRASATGVPALVSFDVRVEGPSEHHPVEIPQRVHPFTAKLKPYDPTVLYKKTKDNIKNATTNVSTNLKTISPYRFNAAVDNSPRGYLDVVKEDVAVAVAYPSASSPTPFGLTVIVKGEAKWKLCFDTQAEQIMWLTAITDFVVGRSIQEYNDATDKPLDVPTKQLKFVLQPRVVECSRLTPGLILPGSFCSDSGAKASLFDDAMTSAHRNHQWVVTPDKLFLILIVMNGFLFVAHAYPDPRYFWYIVALLNIGIWMCLVSIDKCESRRIIQGTNIRCLLCSAEIPVDDSMNAPILVPAVDSGDGASCSKDGGSVPTAHQCIISSPSALPEEQAYKPVAGTTTMQVNDPTDPAVSKNGHPFAKWRPQPGSIFYVRSQGYLSSKLKMASPSELYRLIAVDIFESQARVPDVAARVQLPKVDFDDGDAKKTWVSPDVFVVSFALPTEAPSIYRPTTDGQGYTVTMYYVMKASTREILRRITAPDFDDTIAAGHDDNEEDETSRMHRTTLNAIKLFEKWCKRAPTDENFQARFKVIVLGQNLKEIGVPMWISKYNGKPFLIKRAGTTGFVYKHEHASAIEFDISFYHFPYLFKQGTAFLKESFFKKVVATFGFVIEGRDDDELPECVIGEGMQICYPDPAIAIQADLFFTGKSPKAHT